MKKFEVTFKKEKEIEALNKMIKKKGMDESSLLRQAFRFYHDYEKLLEKHNGNLEKVHEELREMAKPGLCLAHERW